jgi:hypothetical protein
MNTFECNMRKMLTDELTELIAENLDSHSGFLIPLSSRYSASEWNAALRRAIAVRAGKKGRPSPAGPDKDQPFRKTDPPHGA